MQVFTLRDEGEEGESGDEFDDDFLARAMGDVGSGEDGEEDDEDCDDRDFDSDFGGGAGYEEDPFAGEEVRSKFTEYSMSSSVVPRSENLRTLDDKFEKFFDEYLEENIGGLDYDEIEVGLSLLSFDLSIYLSTLIVIFSLTLPDCRVTKRPRRRP